jgi:hypothetical protein
MKTLNDIIAEAVDLDNEIKNTTDLDKVAELLVQLANCKEEFWRV